MKTLAAAYGELADFEEAVRWQKNAIEIASKSEAEDYEARLKTYTSKKPFRIKPRKNK